MVDIVALLHVLTSLGKEVAQGFIKIFVHAVHTDEGFASFDFIQGFEVEGFAIWVHFLQFFQFSIDVFIIEALGIVL